MKIPLYILSLLAVGCQANPGLRPRDLATGASGSRSTFSSLFEVEYDLSEDNDGDIALAAEALAVAYNGLVENSDDAFDRRLERVDIIDIEMSTGYHGSSATATLLGTGSCVGCPSDSKFTSDSSGGKGAKSGKKGGNSPVSLPTEEEVLLAYADEVRSLYISVIDVIDLDEEGMENGIGVEVTDAKKESSKGTKNASKTSKKGSLMSEKGSKKSSKQSKAKGKGGEKSSKQSKLKGAGSKKRSKKSGKGNPTPAPTAAPTCPFVEDVGTQSGPFTSFFLSVYDLISDSDVGVAAAVTALPIAYNRVAARYAADIAIEEAFLFDETSGRRLSVSEARHRRKLQFSLSIFIEVLGFCTNCERQLTLGNQVDDGGDLVEIDIGGPNGGSQPATNTTTGSNTTTPVPPVVVPTGNTTIGTRRLVEDTGCLLPGLPSAEEVRAEYNLVIEELDIENINECVELEEIERPTFPSKGKGKSSKRGARRNI